MRGRDLVAAVVVVGAPATGVAEPAEIGIEYSIRYDPPPGCPDRFEFEHSIASRATGARVVDSDRAAIAFDVELTSGADGIVAALVTTLRDGTRFRRDVTAEGCSEAVSTLAVIAALALNGYRDAQGSGTAPSQSATAAPDMPESVESPADAKPALAPAAQVPAGARTDQSTKPASSEASSRAQSLRPGMYAGAMWESAVAPNAPAGGLAGFELAWERSGAFWPIVRGGIIATLTGSVTEGGGSASFRLIAARLGFCPMGYGGAKRPSIHACLELDGGSLIAAPGTGIDDPQTQSMPWLAAGPAVRGEWPLLEWLSVEASAGFRVLVRHDRFVFRPETEVYDVPPLSGGLALGIVGRMP